MRKYGNVKFKLTPQRMAILDHLAGNRSHPSAEDIYKGVLKRFPTMSFATVYNTLDVLRKNGDILELTIDPEKKRFDSDTKLHHHLICVKCRSIVDIHRKFSLNITSKEVGGFEIVGNHIEFYGICPKCRKQS